LIDEIFHWHKPAWAGGFEGLVHINYVRHNEEFQTGIQFDVEFHRRHQSNKLSSKATVWICQHFKEHMKIHFYLSRKEKEGALE